MLPAFDAVVLAGGAAARLGGLDKPGLQIGGRSLLDRVLDAAAGATNLVVVGPPRAVSRRPVLTCRESPPGGGPVAALAAGVAHTDASIVVVLAGDLPWVGPAVPRLVAALADPSVRAAALTASDGRFNPLVAGWRRPDLLAALRRAPARHRPMRAVFDQIALTLVPDEGGWGLDCDTPAELDQARERARRLARADEAAGSRGACDG
jgi:molybdopterin-guanine dinucleotide biosynthesis protein A